ncbi:asparagine synthase (glutamine-hydrolyzing) [Noviherbaspirillum sp. Root189]|uniref:asparagine synthase (glutamine-hydrolyzing) n=1 Tax=Noviherbaspirillum sp. Root189 TaxID=1736487 RepID=UPI000709B294|nr:asparagine synthase (glutamine-hydrolyzing) [Noviherbaspirillum sp. Root189]KRB81842.1 asparagine synthase [Noviherbaspirillum sp. Root189]
MCGIAGFLGGESVEASTRQRMLKRMTDAIAYRGPDDGGGWNDADCRIALGHRRLAIVDLSDAGRQPMESASGRYVLVFNGEIYNHLALRKRLEAAGRAAGWRGHSDTETLLACFDAWGIECAVKESVGMFAFAVWDRHAQALTLVRDRLGEKPLYYGWQGQGRNAAFLFASELKALRAHPACEARINRDAICLLLRHNAIAAPHSIYEGIFKLMPGTILTVSLTRTEPAVRTYWSAADVARSGAAQAFTGNAPDAIDSLDAVLRQAVHGQMVADVPLGAFLSGGIDSSLVVALMQAQSTRPVKTFSIGFEEQAYNEAEYAKAVARHLGTDHTELYVSASQAMDVIPRLPDIYDEPFSDQSQIPTYLVSAMARRHVTVSLSGDGGDELFCGYERYQAAASMAALWAKIAPAPLPLRKLMARGITGLSPQVWDRIGGVLSTAFLRRTQPANLGHKLHKGAGVLSSTSSNAMYRSVMSHWHDPTAVVINGREPATVLSADTPSLDRLGLIERMMALDTLSYLPDDILVKVDRAAMAVSLETRAPFLDHRVVEFAWQLPNTLKLCDGQSKWVLRQVLYRYVPRALIDRPKMGFAVPVGAWLRGPLREWAEELLDPARLRSEGFFHAAAIRSKWNEHLSGSHNWEYHLWDVLMFQAWLEKQSHRQTELHELLAVGE